MTKELDELEQKISQLEREGEIHRLSKKAKHTFFNVKKIKLYHELLDIDPLNVSALLGLGKTYEKIKIFDEAIRYYQNYFHYSKKSQNGLVNFLFDKAYNSKSTMLSQAYYQKVIEFDPNHSEALNNLGLIYLNSTLTPEDLSTAENCFQRSISADSNWYLPYQNLADVYFKKAFYGKAAENLEKSINLDPVKSNAHSKLTELRKIAPYIGQHDLTLPALTNIVKFNLDKMVIKCQSCIPPPRLSWRYHCNVGNPLQPTLRFEGKCPNSSSDNIKQYTLYDVLVSPGGDILTNFCTQHGSHTND